MGTGPLTANRMSIPPEAKECLERLLQHPEIMRAPRIRSVLSFLIERMLAGREDEISEDIIGQLVFGKPEGYNRGDDNIVRVTVRHLRAKLSSYYSTDGRGEAWVLEIPKGNYVPVLRPRTLEPETIEKLFEAPAAPSRLSNRVPWVLSAVLLVGNLIFGTLWYSQWQGSSVNDAGFAQELFFKVGQRVSIISTDSNLQLFRMMYKQTVTLSDYISRSHIKSDAPTVSPELRGALTFIRSSTDTSLASSLVAQRLQRAGAQSHIRMRHPREVAMSDFQQDNMILLGGPWINPWGQLFEGRLNFRLIPPKEDATISQVVNLGPQAGEPPIFRNHREGAFDVGYARIALLPNLSNSGKVLLVGATDQGAIEASGQYLVDPAALRELLARLQISRARDLPFFELVLEVRSVNITPQAVRTIASRVVHAGRSSGPAHDRSAVPALQ